MRRRGFRGGSNFSSRPAQAPLTVPSYVLPPDRDMYDGLHKENVLKKIDIPRSVDVARDDEVKISEVRYIGSYNWMKGAGRETTIIVPGSPPEWYNRSPPFQVNPDTGIYWVDQNGYHFPRAIFQSLIVAVNEVQEKPFDWSSLDIVTDRNNLRKLLRWISSPTASEEVKPFRIDTQLAGKRTVLLNRWEKRYREYFSGYTYGFNFETSTTRKVKGCEQSSGHHRIITYDLNGLKMVVRFEVDACIPSTGIKDDLDDITSRFASTSLNPSQNQENITEFRPMNMPSIRIIKGGSEVPQASIIEIGTVGQKRLELGKYTYREAYGQLFLSQTPNHYLGVHNSGYFKNVKKSMLGSPSSELGKVAGSMKEDCKKLRRALGAIVEIVRNAGKGGRLSLVFDKNALKVYERTSDESCLPTELMNAF